LTTPEYDDVAKMVMHSTASHGPDYMFTLIDAAIWLFSSNPALREVEVILHPVDRGITFEMLVACLHWKSLLPFHSLLKRRIISIIKNKAEYFYNLYRSNIPADLHGRSIFDRIYSDNESVVLETKLGDIILHLSESKFNPTFRSRRENYLTARRLWKSCYQNGKFEAQRLLGLHYHGVHIGDLVASHELRAYPEAGGSIHDCPMLFSTLVTAVGICNYIERTIPNNLGNHIVTIPEATYLHAIYKRAIHSMGGKVLEPENYAAHYEIIEPTDKLQNPFSVQALISNSLSEADVSRVETNLRERIKEPQKHLWDMFIGSNRPDGKLLDHEGAEIYLRPKMLYAVVFLHSFDDGQYTFGEDGFDDIYHWSVATIDSLLANEKIAHVFVKSHPNIDYKTLSGDRIALERIRLRYANNDRFGWLDPFCPLVTLSREGHFIGITHHGSVAEELVFLGVPVIGSQFAPWSNAYPFLTTWSDRLQYEKILRDLSPENWQPPSKPMRDCLYRYVIEYRLDNPPVHERAPWLKYGISSEGKIPAINTPNYEYYEKILASLALNDLETQKFLDYLVSERLKNHSVNSEKIVKIIEH
jgi:hypothetical protein